jgi:hypothetical protein
MLIVGEWRGLLVWHEVHGHARSVLGYSCLLSAKLVRSSLVHRKTRLDLWIMPTTQNNTKTQHKHFETHKFVHRVCDIKSEFWLCPLVFQFKIKIFRKASIYVQLADACFRVVVRFVPLGFIFILSKSPHYGCAA